MRRSILLTLLALMVAGMVGIVAAECDECQAPVPGYAFTTSLTAGQTIPVGTVSVWNDEECLYVQYDVTEDDWYLLETHLDVECGEPEIAQTKTGNPIPGQFDYGESFALSEMETGWCQAIAKDDLGECSDCGESLAIAAHAAVVEVVDDCWETVWMIGDVEDPTCSAGSLLSNYMDEFNVIGSSTCALDNGYCPYQAPVFADPFVVGTNADSEFPFMADYNPIHNSVNPCAPANARYGTDFDVQWNGALPVGGKLTLSWSPGQSATETKRISGDGILIAQIFIATGTPTPGQGWFLDKYPLAENIVTMKPLADGTHTIRFEHTTGDGTFWDWVKLEKPCLQYETAWGVGTPFVPRGNWGMWFGYEWMCPICDCDNSLDVSFYHPFQNVDDDTSGWSTTDATVTLGTNPISLLGGAASAQGYNGHDVASISQRGTRGLGVDLTVDSDEPDEIDQNEKIAVSFNEPWCITSLEVRSLFNYRTDNAGLAEKAKIILALDGTPVGSPTILTGIQGAGTNGVVSTSYPDPVKINSLTFESNEPGYRYNEFAVAAFTVCPWQFEAPAD